MMYDLMVRDSYDVSDGAWRLYGTCASAYEAWCAMIVAHCGRGLVVRIIRRKV